MNFLNTVEKDILNKFKENNIPLDEVKLLTSSKKELGDYQINDAMKLAKILHKSPREIAEVLVKCLEETGYFKDINIDNILDVNIFLKSIILYQVIHMFVKADI